MKNKLLLIIAATLFASCQKENVNPGNVVMYKVSCDDCMVYFTNNTHRQVVKTSGNFEYTFVADVKTYLSLRVEVPENKPPQDVTMKIIGNDLTVEYSGLVGNNFIFGKEIVK